MIFPPSEPEWSRSTSAVFGIGNRVHDARNQCSRSARISVHDARNRCSQSTGARNKQYAARADSQQGRAHELS
ncbi:MAG: hypothetical protein AABY89_04975, partial [Acidobacteriota bacterium]